MTESTTYDRVARAAIEVIEMLDLAKVNLQELEMALEDHSYDLSWWFDPSTGGTVAYHSEELSEEAEEDHPEHRGLVPVEAIPSNEGYADMEDFIERVGDPHARDLLDRAIRGRGAFRRFKDALLDFPELREAWFAFHDARMARRALEWLVEQGLLDPEAGKRAAAEYPDPDPPETRGPLDPLRVAKQVAEELRTIYGGRLRQVILFGSWARGDAHPESDIDLLVVLDRVESPWEELRRMDEALWRISLEHDVVISEVPASEEDVRRGSWPLLRRAAAEGRSVA
jgi:predicted nucleotidyltransferase